MSFIIDFIFKRFGLSAALSGVIGYGLVATVLLGLFWGLTSYYYNKGHRDCNSQWEQGVLDARDRADIIQDDVDEGATALDIFIANEQRGVRELEERQAVITSQRMNRIERLLEEQRYAPKDTSDCALDSISYDSWMQHAELDRILSSD